MIWQFKHQPLSTCAPESHPCIIMPLKLNRIPLPKWTSMLPLQRFRWEHPPWCLERHRWNPCWSLVVNIGATLGPLLWCVVGVRCTYWMELKVLLPSLKLTAKAPENRPFAPKGKDRLPTIHFQVQTVSFRECKYSLGSQFKNTKSKYQTTNSTDQAIANGLLVWSSLSVRISMNQWRSDVVHIYSGRYIYIYSGIYNGIYIYVTTVI